MGSVRRVVELGRREVGYRAVTQRIQDRRRVSATEQKADVRSRKLNVAVAVGKAQKKSK
jgi:hypothetical protein